MNEKDVQHLENVSSRQVLLVEDLPNVLNDQVASETHASLQSFLFQSGPPLVILVSDVDIRDPDQNHEGGFRDKSRAITIRNLLPPSILDGPYCRAIKFNPIASSIMLSALKVIKSKIAEQIGPSKLNISILKLIIEHSHGDIRSAITTLQLLSCCPNMTNSGKRSLNMSDTKEACKIVAQREHSLDLFHVIGKILYNKRPSCSCASVLEA